MAAGLIFLQRLVAADDSLYGASWRGLTIGLMVFAVSGTAQRFWRGSAMKSASAAGVGLEFEETTSRFGLATGRSLRLLEQRVNDQMLKLSERLLSVEQEVAKSPKRQEDSRE